jgi:hypothetical protein
MSVIANSSKCTFQRDATDRTSQLHACPGALHLSAGFRHILPSSLSAQQQQVIKARISKHAG